MYNKPETHVWQNARAKIGFFIGNVQYRLSEFVPVLPTLSNCFCL